MAHMSVPCHEGPPATKGHFSSEPALAGRGRYYCNGIMGAIYCVSLKYFYDLTVVLCKRLCKYIRTIVWDVAL